MSQTTTAILNGSTRRRKRAPYLKDKEGKALCRCGCGQYPVAPRRTWFSDACVEKYRIINDVGFMRLKLFDRDKGICCACGLDTEKFWKRMMRTNFLPRPEQHSRKFREHGGWNRPFMRDKYERACAAWRKWVARWSKARDNRMVRMKAAGWVVSRSTPWDADHKVPVAEGGGLCGLENMQTLCHPCHKRKTAEQARRKAAKARGCELV